MPPSWRAIRQPQANVNQPNEDGDRRMTMDLGVSAKLVPLLEEVRGLY